VTLQETIARLAEFDESQTIYAARPWEPFSEAVVTTEPADRSLPAEAVRSGCHYFLEVFIASEFLQEWRVTLGREPSLLESCNKLIEYAQNDA
jgi:hypothetical protein